MNREAKRQEFKKQEEYHYRGPNRVIIVVVALVAVLGVLLFTQLTKDTTAESRRWQGGTYHIGQTMDYKNQTITMTDMESVVAGDQILMNLQQVVDSKIIFTRPAGFEQALMAYISPAGRLVVSIAMCEPCRSERFHIEGNNLVCDTCGTLWVLNDLKGISGGCTQYPPEELPYQVSDGQVTIDGKLVSSWTPRI